MVFGEGSNRFAGELLLVKIGEKSFTYYFFKVADSWSVRARQWVEVRFACMVEVVGKNSFVVRLGF